jgi:hypothetical protein
MAEQQGADPEQVRRAISAIVPELSYRLERNTLSRGGLADLVGALGAPQHAGRLIDESSIADPTVAADGNAILQHIVGGKDASRAIAADAARASGLSESLIKMLLPFIASMLMSALQRYLQGGLGDILKRLPGQGNDPPTPRGGHPERDSSDGYGRGFELPKQGPIEGIPDRGGYSPVERPRYDEPDLETRPSSPPPPGSFPQQSPLPLPGDPPSYGGGRNPFDDISDILRRRNSPKVDDQPVGRSVRDLLGGILGFSSRGVIGWIIRLVFLRFGWGILKRLLGRMLGGR